MELPQQRPFGTEGRKATHDFLSLYGHSSVHQDPRPPSQGGGYLKTHDFLQPLERGGKARKKEETVEKPPPPAPPPSVEHILPGGIGTYSISHVSYFNQRVPKPEGAMFAVAQATSSDKNDENSNCSSYTGSGFTLWDESALKKGKTGKENLGERSNVAREAAPKPGQWTTLGRPSQSSSDNHRNSFNSRSSSQPPGQTSQSFMEMIKSAKGSTQDDEFDDEEDFVIKKESTSPIRKPELTVKIGGKSTDQKANTPRSKHSATEQRRRSKINDRFQTLRELIPHGDHKRDKASFLLEVIEYIQFLQEKVQKYEGSCQEWNLEPAKLVPWRNNSNRSVESYGEQSQPMASGTGPALLFAGKRDEKNINIHPPIPGTAQIPVGSDINSASTFKAIDQHAVTAGNAMPFAMSLQPNFFNTGRTGGGAAQLAPRLGSDPENITVQHQAQSSHTRLHTFDEALASDKLKEQELAVEGGTISISSVYSQGLLNTLTQALHSSGVDLSQASVSVQIELGKRGNSKSNALTSVVKDGEVIPSNQRTTRSRVSDGEESDQVLKKLKKTSNS